MARTFSRNDLELLGYRDITQIDIPTSQAFQLYEAKATAGLSEVRALFGYLHAAATSADVREARRAMSRNADHKYLLLPNSMSPRLAQIQVDLGATVKVLELEKTVWEATYGRFKGYLDKVVTSLPEEAYYVTPRPEREAKENLDDNIYSWMASRQETTDHVIALLADAGIGKTTVSRAIAKRLAKAALETRVIPVYLEAGQWAKARESFDDVWDITLHSIRHFDSSLTVSSELLTYLVRVGAVAFIIDGFDELCANGGSQFNARDTLNRLLETAQASDARVLLTSRSLYWSAEIGDKVNGIRQERLAPFTRQQALDYLDRRFSKERDLRSKALDWFNKIRPLNQPPTPGGRTQILYHPFVIGLIAGAVESDAQLSQHSDPLSNDMYSILRAFCSREQSRQRLKTSPDEQLCAFEIVATELATTFDIDDLIMAGYSSEDTSKLSVHPLIEKADVEGNASAYRFRYTFLPLQFKARRVLKGIVGATLADDRCALSIMEEYAGGALIDHVLSFLPDVDLANALAKAYCAVPEKNVKARSFLFHLARDLITKRDANITKKERLEKTLSELGLSSGSTAKGLYIKGAAGRLDLRGITFQSCTFSDVVFADCDVDSSTIFRQCRFEGDFDLSDASRDAWQQVTVEKCELDIPAQLLIGRGNSSQRVANELVKLALCKFWRSGRIVRSFAAPNWKRGILGRHKLCMSILHALVSAGIIEEITISGVAEGGLLLRKEADSEVQRFMDNNQTTGRIGRVIETIQKLL
ncbi:MAG: NACHT domain-containing protein [Planctomycetes bacterium]|nr:NACHT domain-containing protein [Planctomycetota bacterium]